MEQISTDTENYAYLFQSAEEVDQPLLGQVTGVVPPWLHGTYLFLAPGKMDFASTNFTFNHFLDSYAIVCKFTISHGKVTLVKKYLQSDSYVKGMRIQKPVITEFGTRGFADTSISMLQRMMSVFSYDSLTDNCCANLYTLGKDLVAAGESCFFRQLEVNTLLSPEKFGTIKLFGCHSLCPHPLRDDDGNVFNIGTVILPIPKYVVLKMSPKGSNQSAKEMLSNSVTLCTIPCHWTSRVATFHSFGMSQHYIVFLEQPYVLTGMRIPATLIKGYSYKDWLDWRPQDGNRFHIVHKASGRLLKTQFKAACPFYFLHVINCYEDENRIVLDVDCHPDTSIVDNMTVSRLRSGNLKGTQSASIQRFVIPIIENVKDCSEELNLIPDYKPLTESPPATAIRHGTSIVLSPEVITERGLNFQTINKHFEHKKHSFIYGSPNVFCEDHTRAHSISKVDVNTKEVTQWKGQHWNFPNEPTFVANPESTGEDDGILISPVASGVDTQDSFLLILDAKSMKELARVSFSAKIPVGTHGIFLPGL